MLSLSEHLEEIASKLVEHSTICSNCDNYRYYEDTGAECSCDFCVTEKECPLSNEIAELMNKADSIEEEIGSLISSKERAFAVNY